MWLGIELAFPQARRRMRDEKRAKFK
jgi:hypothetical protein